MEAIKRSSADNTASEDFGRQRCYALLARILSGHAVVKSEAFAAGAMAGETQDLNRAFGALSDALADISQNDFEQHYHDLFIGLGRGELLPYGSYYLTGFLNEKPLAELRGDLARLGFGRAEGVREPEDHMAALCDVMAQLIEATAAGEFPADVQRRFFTAHIQPWARQFFADLEAAKSAGPFAPVGQIGRIFMAIEEQGFEMLEPA